MKKLGVINALRGLSALGIVLYHVRLPLWTGWQEISVHPEKYSLADQMLAYPGAACHFFGQAVMLFFVISGFCIHYPYAARARSLELKPYAVRRFIRVYPPYLAAVALSVAATYLTYHYWAIRDPHEESFWRSIFMTQNYPPDSAQIDINPALWSLPVEMELYLAYPIFHICLVRLGLRTSLGLALVVTLMGQGMRYASHLNFPHVDWHNFSLYWLTWCGGAWAAEKLATGSLPKCGSGWVISMALLLGVAIISDSKFHDWYMPGQRLIWGGFFFLLFTWCLRHVTYEENTSSVIGKAMNGLGAISYSLYLTHYPFLMVCGNIVAGPHLEAKPSNFMVPVMFTGLSILFAVFFYKIIERPCHHWARRWGRSS